MCGIVAYEGKDQAAPVLIEGLKALQYRGYDSAGIATYDGHLHVDKCLGEIELDSSLLGNVGIGHTRWATNGEVSLENAHPHLDCSGTIAVVHNGIITNVEQLKAELKSTGHIFVSDTDSEIVAHLLEDGSSLDVLEGDYSLAWIKDGRLYTASRNMSLLKHESEHGTYWSSCKQEASDRQGYSHWMLKEIFEQNSSLNKVSRPCYFLVGSSMTIIGCGSSYHAALVGSRWLDCNACLASELKTAPFIVLALSQSGETADVLQACRAAKQKGSRIIAVTNSQDSSLARMSYDFLLLNQGVEVGVAATKTFTAMLQVLKFLGNDSKVPDVNSVLTRNDEILSIAQTIKQKNIFILGSGIHYPIALEAALKLKEVAYVHAEAIYTSELKHGPLALVNEDVLVIATYGVSDSTLNEIRSRKGNLLMLGNEDVILESVLFQLLAYHLGVLHGNDVDKPRNLAKSVTVI